MLNNMPSRNALNYAFYQAYIFFCMLIKTWNSSGLNGNSKNTKLKSKQKACTKYDIPFLLTPDVIEAIPTFFSLRLLLTIFSYFCLEIKGS